MHPILADLRKLLSYIVAWLLIGLLIAKFIVQSALATWSTALYFALPVTLIYGFVAGSAYYVCRPLPITGRPIVSTILLFCFASFFSGGIWLALCLAWNSLATAMEWWTIHFTESSKSLLFSAGTISYLISLFFHDVLIAADRVRRAELAATKSQVDAREAELQMLRAQINPHFLFNSLNSISALTSIDPVAARSMTIALAQFFRLSLTVSGESAIPLNQEIELCERFLDVEKIRFGSKLQSQFQIDALAKSALIPPMLLQPLIENAVKHGIRDLSDGGTIEISCKTRDAWLHILVDNPCQESTSGAPGNGLGLANIKQRLTNSYANQARIQWFKRDDRFTVEITLPLAIRT